MEAPPEITEKQALAVRGALRLKNEDDALFRQVRSRLCGKYVSKDSQRSYGAGFDDFWMWCMENAPGERFCRRIVEDYRAHLVELVGRERHDEKKISYATANLRLAAVRRAAVVSAEIDLLAFEDVAAIQAVKGLGRKQERAGNWLTAEETNVVLAAPDRRTLKGKRDAAIVALLFGCGIRRKELVSLEVETFVMTEARWVLKDIVGKGDKCRTVPVPAWVKVAVDEWLAAAKIESGKVFRGMRKGGRLRSQSLSGEAVLQVVEQYARAATRVPFKPHDARRTCAKLCRKAGGRLEAIQELLGHESIETTSAYLGSDDFLTNAVNDSLPLGFKE